MIQKLALVVAATVVGLLLAEAAARVSGFDPGYGQLVPPGDPRTVETFQSTIRTVDRVPLWRDRSPRVRPEDIARAAADHDAFVVVGLGDSIMYGMALPKEDTYLEQVRLALANRTPEPVEVLNLAVQGYNTAQEDAVYHELSEQLTPDLVLLHYSSDDGRLYRAVGGYVVDLSEISEDGRLVVRALPVSPSINDLLLLHSRVYQLLTHAAVRYQRRTAGSDWSRVATPLTALSERVRRSGAHLVVLATANLGSTTPQPNAELPQLRALASEHGFDVVDLVDWLDGRPSGEVGMDHFHLNANGHRRIAAHLTDYVVARVARDSAPKR